MKTTFDITPCPSPSGQNNEGLYLVRGPRGVSQLALDGAMRKKFGSDEEEHGKLRDKLAYGLGGILSDEYFSAAMDVVDECLGTGSSKRYGETEDDVPGEWERDREQEREGEDEEGEIPRNAREGGMRGRTGEDRRRRAHDRRLGMDSAERSFEEFYGASRIQKAL
jgi:hypothetical protein